MKHEDIWRAIDALAAEHGLSASGLARKAGLDPTTFNKSKRRTADGHERWPGTESVSKILAATGASLESFTALVTGTRALTPSAVRRMVHRRIPLIGFAQAGGEGYFDDGGYPVGGSWDEVGLPDVTDPHAYALEISGESMEPVFRDGDTVIVSPAAPIRRGDRVVLRTARGDRRQPAGRGRGRRGRTRHARLHHLDGEHRVRQAATTRWARASRSGGRCTRRARGTNASRGRGADRLRRRQVRGEGHALEGDGVHHLAQRHLARGGRQQRAHIPPLAAGAAAHRRRHAGGQRGAPPRPLRGSRR